MVSSLFLFPVALNGHRVVDPRAVNDKSDTSLGADVWGTEDESGKGYLSRVPR